MTNQKLREQVIELMYPDPPATRMAGEVADQVIALVIAQHDAETLKHLKKLAKHYTADSLEADGLDTWAVPLSVLEQYQPQKGADANEQN